MSRGAGSAGPTPQRPGVWVGRHAQPPALRTGSAPWRRCALWGLTGYFSTLLVDKVPGVAAIAPLSAPSALAQSVTPARGKYKQSTWDRHERRHQQYINTALMGGVDVLLAVATVLMRLFAAARPRRPPKQADLPVSSEAEGSPHHPARSLAFQSRIASVKALAMLHCTRVSSIRDAGWCWVSTPWMGSCGELLGESFHDITDLGRYPRLPHSLTAPVRIAGASRMSRQGRILPSQLLSPQHPRFLHGIA